MRVDWDSRTVISKVDKAVKAASKKGADLVALDAKHNCPVGEFEKSSKGGFALDWKQRKPGTLRDSIKVQKSRFKGGGYIVKAGGYMAYYAQWVELGAPARSAEQWRTAGHAYPVPRQPFLRPAANQNQRKLNNIFQNELNRTL